MPSTLMNALAQRILLADGAMGTRLQSLVGNTQTCIDSLNLDSTFSEIVGLVHRSYLDAGADLITTNTYGANAVKLGRYGRQGQVTSINQEGARIARRCVDQWNPTDASVEAISAPLGQRFVGGSVGPLEVYSVRDEYSENMVEEIFFEQMSALVQGGVDYLLLETFQDLFEAVCALRVAQRFDLPVFFSVGGVQGGRTGTGADAREFASLATKLGASAMGCNCRGPYDILETLQVLAQVTSLPLLAMPNAGSPEIDRGRVAYHIDPDQFSAYAVQLVKAGACIVGGCCGTEPRHIQQVARAVKLLPLPAPRHVAEVRVVPTPRGIVHPDLIKSLNPVAEVFRKLPFVVSVEMRPGRERPLEEFLAAGRKLSREGVHLFDVPDNAGAKVTVDPLVAASRLQQETRVPTIMHLSTSHRNLVATQSYLLGCAHAGIRAVLAVTGDHPNVGDHDTYASRVNDVKSSVNLMSLLGSLNRGRLFNDSPCLPTDFMIGGGFNPVRGLTAQIKWLQKKVAAGAQFVFTQPVYREEDVDRMLEATRDVQIPILVGILPLLSRRNAEFFAAGKIPGIIIPPEILARYEGMDNLEDSKKLGLDLATELLSKIRSKVRGIYLLPPFGKASYEVVETLLQRLDLDSGAVVGSGS